MNNVNVNGTIRVKYVGRLRNWEKLVDLEGYMYMCKPPFSPTKKEIYQSRPARRHLPRHEDYLPDFRTSTMQSVAFPILVRGLARFDLFISLTRVLIARQADTQRLASLSVSECCDCDVICNMPVWWQSGIVSLCFNVYSR